MYDWYFWYSKILLIVLPRISHQTFKIMWFSCKKCFWLQGPLQFEFTFFTILDIPFCRWPPSQLWECFALRFWFDDVEGEGVQSSSFNYSNGWKKTWSSFNDFMGAWMEQSFHVALGTADLLFITDLKRSVLGNFTECSLKFAL